MIDSIAITIAATFCNCPTINPEPQQPQRTWVGLTDEEIDYYIINKVRSSTKENLSELIRFCEKKLKEKNT